LQIEPGRGDLRADRARGIMQEIEDIFRVKVHRHNLISVRSRAPRKFDSGIGADIPQWRLRHHRMRHADTAVFTPENRAFRRYFVKVGWRRTMATIRMQE